MKFTREQEAIFEFVKNGKGHGIIDAVAGAGKTTTIMECAKYVDDPSQVLFCAFNRSIAGEIDYKFSEKGMNLVTTKTIHSLGLWIIKDNNKTAKNVVLNDRKYENLLKQNEIRDLLNPYIQEVVNYHGYEYFPEEETQDYAVKNLVYFFGKRILEINTKYRLTLCKDSFQEFKELVVHYGIFNSIEMGKRDFDNELECYFEAHRLLLERANAYSAKTMIIDYADMLYLPYFWEIYPAKKFNFLFIDECQDLSRSQLAVALKFAKKGGRVLAVGDPRQSIYGFTGADIESFGKIESRLKAKKLPLTACFRCPQGVIEIAREIRTDIVGNKDYSGLVVKILNSEIVDEAKNNDLIISRTKDPLLLLIFDFIDKDIKIKIHPDIAQELVDKLRRLFKREELFYRIKSPQDFEQFKEKVLSRRKWVVNKEAERIIDRDERSAFITVEMSVLEKELDFLHKRWIIWKNDANTIEEILKRLHEFVNQKKDPIVLSTIHTAKGLESDRVIILNYPDLPLKHSEQKEWEKVQELNLKYVAVTRTKEELYLAENINLEEEKEEGSLFDELFDL